MIKGALEIAQFEIIEGKEDAFEAAVTEGAALFKAASGCRHLWLERSVERPSHYCLFIEWDSIEDHVVKFRSSEASEKWKNIIGGLFFDRPSVDHMREVLRIF